MAEVMKPEMKNEIWNFFEWKGRNAEMDDGDFDVYLLHCSFALNLSWIQMVCGSDFRKKGWLKF